MDTNIYNKSILHSEKQSLIEMLSPPPPKKKKKKKDLTWVSWTFLGSLGTKNGWAENYSGKQWGLVHMALNLPPAHILEGSAARISMQDFFKIWKPGNKKRRCMIKYLNILSSQGVHTTLENTWLWKLLLSYTLKESFVLQITYTFKSLYNY